MPVVSFTFDKMQVERLKPLEAPIKVESNMKVLDIKEEEVPISGGKKEKVLRFTFEYHIDYTPKQALIHLEGSIIYFEPPEEVKEILKQWKDGKKITAKVKQTVLNNILIRSNIKALLLGQEIGLPPHMVLPMLQPKAEEKVEEYIG